MKEERVLVPDEKLWSKIYLIRGQKVMLDRDLAELFQVKPIRLREQVKRNQNKFPEHFAFQLNDSEVEIMVSQNAIPSKKHLGGALPYVFTEHGILQLGNVLTSPVATQLSIRIIELFVKMREMMLTHKDLLLEVEEIRKKIASQDEHIELVFDYLTQFITRDKKETEQRKIGFRKN